jgi:hypothetical protein
MKDNSNNNIDEKNELVEKSNMKGSRVKADKEDEQGQLKDESIQEHPEH